MAVHAFGATSLARPLDPPSIPTTGDLGMGELPFTSMALSFRLFGVSDWAGRLPLALWGLVGAVSLYLLLARLLHPRAGFFGVLALLSMPLYFLHARTMLGDIVSMAALAMSVAGLALAATERAPLPRLLALAWGAAGLLAGYLTRGALFGLATPLATVGAALLLAAPTRAHRFRAHATGALFLMGGAVALAWFLRLALPLVEARAAGSAPPPLLRAIGMVLEDPRPADSTFDRIVRQLGHGLFPWGGVVLVSFGWLFAPPTASNVPLEPAALEPARRASFLKVLLLVGACISFGSSSLVVPWAGALPFAGVAMLAGAVGVMAHELEGSGAARLAGLAAVMLTLVVYVDIDREPARLLSPFAVDAAAFPVTFEGASRKWAKLVAALVVLGTWLSFAIERPAPATASAPLVAIRRWLVSQKSAAYGLGREVYQAFQGNLVFSFVVLEAGLIGLAGMLFLASRMGWVRITKLPASVTEIGQTAWWALPLACIALPVGWVVLRDGSQALTRWSGLSRGALLMTSLSFAGALLSFGYFPALAEQLSPKSVFAVYAEVGRPGEELGLLGTSPHAGALYSRTPPRDFSDVTSAFDWLTREPEARRFLILKARDLPKLNSQHRARFRRNVAVLDARSSQNVLVSNRLDGAVDQSPFADIVLDEVPSIARPLDARFLENIEVLGWEVVDERDRPIASVKARKSFKLRLYFRVLKRTPGSWQVFVHIDGNERHQTVDHPPAGDRYPLSLWQPGDIIRDEVEVTLEPNLTPGEYWLFFGFFQGSARLHVSEGPNRDDRVIGGRLIVK